MRPVGEMSLAEAGNSKDSSCGTGRGGAAAAGTSKARLVSCHARPRNIQPAKPSRGTSG